MVKGRTTTRFGFNCSYKNDGNVQNTVDGVNTKTCSYDGLDRLTSSTGPWGSITYTYDQVGNRLSKTEGGTTSYSYGTYNRLTQAGSTTYTYDNNGNMITKNDGVDSWSYTYDYNNMMTKAVKNGAVQGQYYYDGDGKRIKVIEGNTKVYAPTGLSIIYESDVSSSTVSKYFYANGLLIARMASLATRYFHEDALGTMGPITNGSHVPTRI